MPLVIEIVSCVYEDSFRFSKYAPGKYIRSIGNVDKPSTYLFTDKVRKAQKFADVKEAFDFLRTQSTRMPLRPHDGKPNRPLTAFTVIMKHV